ncbi:ATP-binding protein [Kibdelosporangium phytohabitans]|uniref:HTH luxR-type domain-containing protein n=1 Tax=Kibdelosporangium phytohabitans TaxID=860235 RepID=A0A0N9HY93_9PSEU|nr:LuxR family transcriptional regulator [Kibdelosporangium phytohabitans]ALG10446.1 hypothetical protein AOZ06_29300 [Kibdelosporangium phytohabitans]MBE1461518.1 DNA-binding NarL/FixJ family response regulator [Kibdelosporangium phytohabitans]
MRVSRPREDIRLTGRDAELAALDEVIEALLTGQPQVVDIQGEPGIGKTRLLDELVSRAESRGITVMSARIPKYGSQPSFVAFSELFERIGLTAPTELPRHSLYATVVHEVAKAAAQSGFAVVLDDLHLADPMSLELLEHLAGSHFRTPVLIAFAYQSASVPPLLPSVLARTRLPVTRLAPGPLQAADVAALVPDATPLRRKLLLTASGGNPLYLRALDRLDGRTITSLADPELVGAEALPDALRALLVTDLRALTETQRQVAYAAAVAGSPADLDVIVTIAGLSEVTVLGSLDELVTLGILTLEGAQFSFRHPLVRAAMYQSAGITWRTRAHRQAELYLRMCGGPLSLRAFHAARAARFGDADAAEILVDAAIVAMDTAPATAAAWLERALEVAPAADRRIELLLARALGLSGDLTRSRRILHDMLGDAGPIRERAVRYCVTTERLLGRFDEAKALLEAEFDRSTDLNPDEAGGLAAERAGIAILADDHETCVHYAFEAISYGSKVDKRGQVATGFTLAALASLRSGATATARERLTTAVGFIDSLPDMELREYIHALPPLAWVELELDQHADAARHVRRGVDLARGSGRVDVLPALLVVEAAVADRAGQLGRARQRAEEARELAKSMGSTEMLATACSVELAPTLWQCGPGQARKLAVNAPESRWWAENTNLALAAIHNASGAHETCVEHITAHIGGASAWGLPGWRGHLAIAQAELGRFDEAFVLADTAVDSAVALDLPFQIGMALHARSRVLTACRKPEAALDDAEAAVRAFSTAPLHRARSQELVALNLAALRSLTQARSQLGHAKEGYLVSRAQWLSTQIRLTETRLGARAPRPRRPDAIGTVAALSGRELQVAELVATGLTNQEVAARLYLSRKTVEGHLARVFTKLGVKSRVGVAQRLAGR